MSFKCDRCEVYFSTRQKLKQHENRKKPCFTENTLIFNKFQCKNCFKFLSSKQRLNDHLNRVNKCTKETNKEINNLPFRRNAEIKCMRCLKIFSSHQRLISHINQLIKCKLTDPTNTEEKYLLDLAFINAKHSRANMWIRNFRVFDKKHNEFDISKFIDYPFLIDLLNRELKCVYCNCEFEYIEKSNNVVSLERINNSLGHIKSNCVLACFGCNKERGNRYTFEEFKELKRKALINLSNAEI
jgi:hypothetical protein